MNNKVLVQELAEALAASKDISKKDAESFVRTVFDIIEENLITDKLVKIKELGTFKLIEVDSRESVNVNTGERIRIASHTKVTFTPDKALADRVNKPFADFETVVLNDNTSTEEMEKVDVPESPVAAVEEPNKEPAVKKDLVEKVAPVVTPLASVAAESKEVASEILQEVASETKSEPEPVAEEASAAPEKIAEEIVPKPEPEQVKEEIPVAAAVSAPVVSAPTEEVKGEVKEEVMPDEQANNPEPIKPNDNVNGGSGLSKGTKIALFLVLMALILGAIFLGFNKCGGSDEIVAESDSVTVDTVSDSLAAAKKALESDDPKVRNAQLAKSYPQLEGGDFWIIGTHDTIEMTAGDNLYRISRRVYADTVYVKYITFYNGIKDANIVPLGKQILLPELRKK